MRFINRKKPGPDLGEPAIEVVPPDETPFSYDASEKEKFTAALANFSLAHTEIMAFKVRLQIDKIAEEAGIIASISEEFVATGEETAASTEEISAGLQGSGFNGTS